MKMSLVIFVSLLRLEFIPYSKIVYDYTFAAGNKSWTCINMCINVLCGH